MPRGVILTEEIIKFLREKSFSTELLEVDQTFEAIHKREFPLVSGTPKKKKIECEEVFEFNCSNPVFWGNDMVAALHNIFEFDCEQVFTYRLSTREMDFLSFSEYRVDSMEASRTGELAFIGNKVGKRAEVFELICTSKEGRSFSRVLKSYGQMDNPNWSPDGKSILYDILNSGSDDGIYLVDVTRKKKNLLVRDGFSQSWSPDGTKIAFCLRDFEGKRGEFIFVMDGYEKVPRFVTEGYGPEWSPDGFQLSFTDRGKGGAGTVQVGIVHFDGTNRCLLTPIGGKAYYPKWSPDGKFLAFPLNGNLCAYFFSSGKIETLVFSEGLDLYVSDVSPDSRMIAYFGGGHGTRTDEAYIYVLPEKKIVDIGKLAINASSRRSLLLQFKNLIRRKGFCCPSDLLKKLKTGAQ